MAGKLYLCATPIGNLDDITLRVLNTLKEVDLIAAEDTRHSIKLLNHFDIKTPMTSYHEYNKVEKARYLVDKLKEGTNIALITDAGTPGISDPGEELVKQCYEAGIELTSLPGPAACITALTISGMATRRFSFEAFLPPDKKEKQRILEELKQETRTMILYEAPHRLVRTLEELMEALGERNITICRELTKKYETAFRTTFSGALAHYENEEPRGECVIVVEGKSLEEIEKEKAAAWEDMTVEEHMDLYLEQGLDRKDAMKPGGKGPGDQQKGCISRCWWRESYNIKGADGFWFSIRNRVSAIAIAALARVPTKNFSVKSWSSNCLYLARLLAASTNPIAPASPYMTSMAMISRSNFPIMLPAEESLDFGESGFF